jgi:hypothetical protein
MKKNATTQLSPPRGSKAGWAPQCPVKDGDSDLSDIRVLDNHFWKTVQVVMPILRSHMQRPR